MCLYAKTLDELRKKEKEINKNIDLGICSNDYTLNQLFERYLDQNVNLKERTKHKYKLEYERWVGKKWIGKKKIKHIVKSDIVKFYKELSDLGLSNGTIKCVNKYISCSLNMAYEDDLIRKNYAIGCIDPYLKTGNRIALTKGDKNSRTAYHIDTTKTENSKRKVPISDDLYELLKTLKKETYFDSYKFNSSVDGYSGFVIHTRIGLPVLTSKLNAYAKRIVDQYNNSHEDKLPKITCHICRHTFCTRLAEMNISPHALQKIVGHGSYSTTDLHQI